MAGERLDHTPLGTDGIPGDRVVHVVDPGGRIVTSSSKPRLLLHHVLLDNHRRFDGEIALDAEVLHPGTLTVGAPASLLPG